MKIDDDEPLVRIERGVCKVMKICQRKQKLFNLKIDERDKFNYLVCIHLKLFWRNIIFINIFPTLLTNASIKGSPITVTRGPGER